MTNTTKETILKILTVIATVVVIVLAIVYANMLKTLKGTSGQGTAPATKTATFVEGRIGTVVTLVTKPNGKVQLTIDSGGTTGQKTYQLPSDQQVKLYTSATETISLPIGHIQKGTIVNIGTYKNPDRYQITGVTDKALQGKLI